MGSSNESNIGRVLGSVTDGPGSLVRVDAMPFVGYEFSGFAQTGPSIYCGMGSMRYNGPWTNFVVAGKNAIAAALFHEKEEYSLDLKPEGEDVPCSGYVTAEPAMKYYLPGTWVTLTATALPGYKFVEWTGDAATWDHGTWPYGPEIAFAMDNDYKIGAKFVKEFAGAPIEAFNPDTCQYCIHGGYPNGKLPDSETPAEPGYLLGDVQIGPLPEGLDRYGPRDDGGDDWGCAYYIHQKLRDVAAAWNGETILFNDISKQGGGPWDHASHQNGLDVDVGYQSTDELSRNLIAAFVASGNCERIFAAGHGITFNNVVRYDANHTGHFHVRYSDPDGLPPEN